MSAEKKKLIGSVKTLSSQFWLDINCDPTASQICSTVGIVKQFCALK